jgi:hypothetical protein
LNAKELTVMTEDDLDDCVDWIDWRAEEEEVVEAVQARISETLTCSWDDEEFFVYLDNKKLKIPVTLSRCDRYVTISSLAEILKAKYVFFLRNGHEGDDTHGLLIVPIDCVPVMRGKHGDWFSENFGELERGTDHFSGLRIPYFGHENNNPQLREELDAMQAAEAGFAAQLENSPAAKAITRELRLQLGTATFKDKASFYARRFWWLVPLFIWFCLR